jgi:hypothetical protein
MGGHLKVLFLRTMKPEKLNFTWIDWLIDYLQFYVPLKNISLIWRRHHCQWRAAKFRPMLGKLSDMEQRQVHYMMGPRGSNGGNEMHIIFLHGSRLLTWAIWPMGLLFWIKHRRVWRILST